jgi:hypothetical protein
VNQDTFLPKVDDIHEGARMVVELTALSVEPDQSKPLFGNQTTVAARLEFLKATLFPPPPELEVVPDPLPEPETPLEPSVEVAPPVPHTPYENLGRWISKIVLTLLLK